MRRQARCIAKNRRAVCGAAGGGAASPDGWELNQTGQKCAAALRQRQVVTLRSSVRRQGVLRCQRTGSLPSPHLRPSAADVLHSFQSAPHAGKKQTQSHSVGCAAPCRTAWLRRDVHLVLVHPLIPQNTGAHQATLTS